MFAPETTFIEAGPALLVGTVGADGIPHATRGWGLTILDSGTGEIRLLLDAEATQARANLLATGAIAITACDVPTLRALQMKGTCTEITPGTDLDTERSGRYRDAFFTAIEQIERTPRVFPERLAPSTLVACTVQVRELFDQTPGPAAGAPVPGNGST